MELVTVKIEKPEAINFILGQTHFIKSVEDIHEALVTAVPGITFGLAFCGSVPVTGQDSFLDFNDVRSGLSSIPKARGGPLRWTTEHAIAAIQTVRCMGEQARKRV